MNEIHSSCHSTLLCDILSVGSIAVVDGELWGFPYMGVPPYMDDL